MTQLKNTNSQLPVLQSTANANNISAKGKSLPAVETVPLYEENEKKPVQKKEYAGEGYETGPSAIHGTGLFANKAFPVNAEIGVGVKGNTVTDTGKYVNHSDIAKTNLKETGADYTIIAKQDIQPGDEITANYAQANAVNPKIKPKP